MRKTAKEWKTFYSDPEFEQNYTYEGHDLGAACTEDGTSILLWSPVAESVTVRFYHDGESEDSVPDGSDGKRGQRCLGIPDKRKCFTKYTMILNFP